LGVIWLEGFNDNRVCRKNRKLSRNTYIVDATCKNVEKKADLGMKGRIEFKTVVVSKSCHTKLMKYSEASNLSLGQLIDAMVTYFNEHDIVIEKGFCVIRIPKQGDKA
jgi:hypothetical protein